MALKYLASRGASRIGMDVQAPPGSTWNSDGTVGNIQNLHDNFAQDGDTITMPSGNFNWSGQLIISKAVTLQGTGATSTTITDDRSGTSLIIINYADSGVTRLTGIGFIDGASTGHGGLPGNGLIKIEGLNTSPWQIRIDHCNFGPGVQGPIINQNSAIGVVDHCWFNQVDTNGGTIYTRGTSWNGYTDGDGSWAHPTNFGGINLLVVEDCFFDKTTGGVDMDGKVGGRVVVRHCTFEQNPIRSTAMITHHGTEGRDQPIRHLEAYNLLFVQINGGRPINQRAGTGVIFNLRVLTAPNSEVKFDLTSDRVANATYMGRASGKNPWDDNDLSGTLGPAAGETIKHFYQGTAAAGTTKTNVVVSPSPGWTVNQWVSYAVTNTSEPDNANNSALDADNSVGSTIESNTANTLTLHDTIFNPDHLKFAPGDVFRIYRPKNTHCEIGRAGTIEAARVTGFPAYLANTNPHAAGNEQVNEPWYGWNNRRRETNGSLTPIFFNTGESYIRECTGGNNGECHYWNNDAVMPGYPWSAGATATIGASGMGLTGSYAPLVLPGYGDYNGQYPHPLVTP